jgi:uncharacterized protein YbaR (Trm112 family)
MALSKDLLDMLVCPECKGKIILLDDGSGIVCRACRLKYPIREGGPVMLVSEAEAMDR